MERPITLRPLSIKDENAAVHYKKAAIDGKSKSLKPSLKKGGAALESRRALNDITNKSSIHVEASLQKKNALNKKLNVVEDSHLKHCASEAKVALKQKSVVNEKVNIAEEGFLHDHNKCVEAHKTAGELNFLDTVHPGCGSTGLVLDEAKMRECLDEAKSDPDIELKEISMTEISDWFNSFWKSPPSSPIHRNSSLDLLWEFEPLELTLEEENQLLV